MKRLLFFLLPLLLGGGAVTKAAPAPPPSPPQVTITDVRMSEGNTGRQNANFRVSLSKASTTTVYVGILTDNVTARAGSDYIATSKTLSFAPGTRAQNFLVPIVGDTTFEPDETFVIRINAKGYASRARVATCTIRNDDAAPRPTATPRPLPTATPRPLPTATPRPLPTATPRPLPTATPRPLPTATAIPVATSTPIPTATPQPTATPNPTATPQPTSTPAPVRPRGKLYSLVIKTFSGLWVVNANGSNLTQISVQGGGSPRWSPDGSKICFAAGGLYVMNADGSGRSRISPEGETFSIGIWSPDGKKILARGRYDTSTSMPATYSLSVMSADGSEFHRISSTSLLENARWSPDSKRILWIDKRDGNTQIYVADSDGSEQTNLSSNSLREGSASWSPDGSRILYYSSNVDTTGGTTPICVMNADGSNKIVIRNDTPAGSGLEWSPNSQKIAFAASDPNHVRPYYGFYIMNSDVPNLLDLSLYAPSDWNPRWSPDSQKLTFPIINRWIYTLNADGSQPVQLKSGSAGNYGPMWSPDGATVGWLAWGNDFYSHIFIANADGSGQIDITPSLSQSAGDFDWTSGFVPPSLSAAPTSSSAPSS